MMGCGARASTHPTYYIRSLGEPGQPAPAYVPPDQEPTTAYARFPSPPPGE